MDNKEHPINNPSVCENGPDCYECAAQRGELVTLVCTDIGLFWPHGNEVFTFWLNLIKASRGCNTYHDYNGPGYELRIYIDPKEIDYDQMLSLWTLFLKFRAKGREELEKLVPYLPQEDAHDFSRWFLEPYKKRKLKNKFAIPIERSAT